MATTKKKPTTKSTPKAAKTSTKSKTVVARKSVPSRSKGSDFWAIEFNITTLFWLAIGIAVIATAAWTYNSSQQISDIYDSIDATNVENSSVPVKHSPKQKTSEQN